MKQNQPPLVEPAAVAADPNPASVAASQDLAELFVQFASAERHVLWVTDTLPIERVHYVSPAFETVWGRSTESLYANPRAWSEAIHPDDRAGVQQAFQRWITSPTEHAFDLEYRIVRPDGGVRWIHDCGQAPAASGRQFGRCTGIAEDITEARTAQDALRAEQQRLAAIAAVAPGVLCSFRRGPDGRMSFPYGGPRIAALYRIPGGLIDDDAGPVFAKIHPDDAAAVVASIEMSARELSAWRAEFRVCEPDGSERWIEGNSSPVAEPDGAITWHGAVADVSERKRNERQLVRLNSELEQRVVERTAELQAAVKEIEAFSYSVSHDLRAPLRALDGFSQALLEDHGALLPDEGRRYLGIIRDTAQKMGHLIDDLLAFSHLGRQALTRRRVDCEQLVRHAFDTLAPQCEGRQIELRVGALPACDADLALLRQVWINLLGNAIKYTRQRHDAVIEVGSVTRDGVTEYFVRDNGAGFDMQYAHKLFGVFERLHRADEFEGSGVGLAIVQRIVQRHGGHVRAFGEVGRGATVYFTLG